MPGNSTPPRRLQNRMIGRATQWSLWVENLTDRSYWREAPHHVLGRHLSVPSTPRTVRAESDG